MVLRGLRYSMYGTLMDSGITRWLGTNLTASALGVGSVWMKIVRAPWGRRSAPASAGVVARDDNLGLVVADRMGAAGLVRV